MLDIWDDLLNYGFVNDESYDETNKLFAINIYQKDIKYLIENYQKIIDYEIIHTNFLIAVSFSNDIGTIKLLVDKFNINTNYSQPGGS